RRSSSIRSSSSPARVGRVGGAGISGNDPARIVDQACPGGIVKSLTRHTGPSESGPSTEASSTSTTWSKSKSGVRTSSKVTRGSVSIEVMASGRECHSTVRRRSASRSSTALRVSRERRFAEALARARTTFAPSSESSKATSAAFSEPPTTRTCSPSRPSGRVSVWTLSATSSGAGSCGRCSGRSSITAAARADRSSPSTTTCARPSTAETSGVPHRISMSGWDSGGRVRFDSGSTTTTRSSPASAASMASDTPAAEAPTTTKSTSFMRPDCGRAAGRRKRRSLRFGAQVPRRIGMGTSVPSDIDIARAARLRPLAEIAERIGLREDELIPFGHTKAKIHLDALKRIGSNPRGKYVVVTAITPTPLGEGKTTTTVGLTQGLGHIGKEAIACIRQPSMGPTFGLKGGAAGAGYSQVVPMDESTPHLPGDIHAIPAAHNLVAAAIDARWYHETRLSDEELAELGLERLSIDVFNLQWNRVVDINDRALRHVVVGLGGKADGRPRETGFDITVASELMAILALVDGDSYASALRNLRERIGRVVFGTSKDGTPLTLEDLRVAGAVAVLMKDTLHPNLMQTLEGQAAFVHAGPFGNIAHGN